METKDKTPISARRLEDLRAGDTVTYTGQSSFGLLKIEKITLTQIVTKTMRFRRDTGHEIGRGPWDISHISVTTDQDMVRITEKKKRQRLGQLIHRGLVIGTAKIELVDDLLAVFDKHITDKKGE